MSSPDDIAASTETADTPEVPFGDDDLGRIQGILFGDYAKKMLDRVDTLEGALLGVIEDLRSELTTSVRQLNDRIDAEAETRSTALGNLSGRVDEDAKATRKEHGAINKRHDRLAADSTKALADAEARAADELASARAELEAAVEAVDARLTEHKVARADLAVALRQAADDLDPDAS